MALQPICLSARYPGNDRQHQPSGSLADPAVPCPAGAGEKGPGPGRRQRRPHERIPECGSGTRKQQQFPGFFPFPGMTAAETGLYPNATDRRRQPF